MWHEPLCQANLSICKLFTSVVHIIAFRDAEMFSQMAVDALMAVEVSGGPKGPVYPIKAVNILKAHGRSMSESMLIDGYALNCTVASQQMPRTIKKAKIAFLDFSLQKVKMKLGVQVRLI